MKRYSMFGLRVVPIMLLAMSIILPLSLTDKATPLSYAGGFDSPEDAMSYFLSKRVPYGETRLPVERYRAAADQIKRMQVYSTATNSFASSPDQGNLGSWTYLGPGNIGGRTRALLVDPNNSNVLLAGGVAGGIWKTTDGGAHWSAKSDFIANIAIGALARGSDGNLYAGTGEYLAADGVAGLGIYLSTDGGETWPETPIASTANLNFGAINRIVVSPSNPGILYVATPGALYRGVRKLNNPNKYTWTNITPGTGSPVVYDIVAVAGQTGDRVVVGIPGQIYMSTSNGDPNTWTLVSPTLIPGATRVTLAVAPNNSNIMYAMIAGTSHANDLNSFLRSTNGGMTWAIRVQGPFNSGNLNTYLLTNPCLQNSHQGQYDNAVSVDPQNPDMVWAGGIELFRSSDGGSTWGIASDFQSAGLYLHADEHVIVFPSNSNGSTMYVGNDGGIFKTTNAHASVAMTLGSGCIRTGVGINWASLNHGYGVTQFYHGTPSPVDGNSYFGGTQDNGTIGGSDSSGPDSWGQFLDSDGGYVAITPSGNTRYAEKQFGFLYRSDGADFNSTFNTDQIIECDRYLGCGDPGAQRIVLPFISVYALDPTNPQRLWFGGSTMWRSDNATATWAQAGHRVDAQSPSPLTNTIVLDDFAGVTAIAFAPGNPNRVLVGTTHGNIIHSDNANASPGSIEWRRINNQRTSAARVSGIAFDPSDATCNTIYVTYSNFSMNSVDKHVYKTTNGGVHWDAIDGVGLPDVPVHCIVVDPMHSQRLYIGTDVGVFVSVDGGVTWARENMGFSNVITETLAIANHNGLLHLYGFTHGRGAWRVALGTAACSPPPPMPPSSLTATAVSSVEIDLQWQHTNLNATGFSIERGPNSTTFAVVATVGVNQHTYNDTGRSPNTPYYYRVKALGSTCGDSGYSNTASATTPPNVTPPTPPGNLIATAPLSTQINLTWQDSDTETIYRIDRKQGTGGTYAEIATAGMNATGYSDSVGIQPNTTYYYRVRACNQVCSLYSNEAFATTPGGPPPPACVSVTLLSGSGTPGYIEGIGAGAQWSSPRGGVVARHPLTGDKALFVADTDNHRIRLVYLDGQFAGRSEWIAGDGVAGYRGGTKPADKVHYNAPMGIGAAIDGNGRVTTLYIADTFNHLVRKLIAPTGVGFMWTPQDWVGVPTVPGNDSNHFNFPQGVTVAADGNVYVSDSDNNLIRKVTSQGIMSTIITGASAGLVGPVGIAVSQSSLLYISDPGTNAIWRATTGGASITRIAGSTTGAAGFQDGTGTAARFNKNYHLVWCITAGVEMLLVSDRQNHRLRKLAIATNGVTTVAGSTAGYQEGDCITAKFNSPRGVGADGEGKVYILDTGNQRIRKVQ